MKYKLPRQTIKQTNIKGIIERELDRQGTPLEAASKKHVKELSEVTQTIKKTGLPDYLVLKKISDQIGHGVFVHPNAKALKKGQLIGPYSGVMSIEVENEPDDSAYAFALVTEMKLNKEEQKRLDSKNKFAPSRHYALNLDANDKGNFTRFINHCENPNVEAITHLIPPNSEGLEEMPIEVLYIAKKTIKPGEQLLVCYEDEDETYWDAYGVDPVSMDPKTYRLGPDLNFVKK